MSDPKMLIEAHDNEVARQVLTDAAAFLTRAVKDYWAGVWCGECPLRGRG